MEPIIYVDKEELVGFIESGKQSVDGISYEWEQEGVIHLHTQKQLHSFGKESKAVFLCEGDETTETEGARFIVYVSSKDDEVEANIVELMDDGELKSRNVSYIPSRADLYSRNKGILEVNVLESKHVMIVGLGSFGSQIAIELAKAGVGSFSLFDFDRVELHNLARHTCTIKDLGRLKTDAIYDAIKGKNPYANVEKYPINIVNDPDLLEREVGKADIVICATDNNESRFKLQDAMIRQKKIGIFGRAVTRAEGGDVFRYVPGGPCYTCLIGTGFYDSSAEEITDVASARRNGRIAAYVSEEEADAMVQVGLSADIEPICNLMIKLTLMELSRGKESGISCLEDELVYDYYMWANRRERRHANWAAMPNAGNKPTILRWYGAHINKVEGCPVCSDSEEILLDQGEDLEAELGNMEGMENIKLE